MGNRDKKEKEKPKDRQAVVRVDEHETDQPVTMAVVRELLHAQESRLKSQFESVVQSLEKRVHDVHDENLQILACAPPPPKKKIITINQTSEYCFDIA